MLDAFSGLCSSLVTRSQSHVTSGRISAQDTQIVIYFRKFLPDRESLWLRTYLVEQARLLLKLGFSPLLLSLHHE